MDVTPMLAKVYDPKKYNIEGWMASEKLDGVRALWDGENFWSRNGNVLHAPFRMTGQMKKLVLPGGVLLDGELYLGRGRFNECSGIVRRNDDQWFGISYQVFDVVGVTLTADKRDALVTKILSSYNVSFAHQVVQRIIKDSEDLISYYNQITEVGGEGLMLKHPLGLYLESGPTKKRSPYLLKLKPQHDIEALVIGYSPGLGKYTGMVGALICRLPSGKEFQCGSGLNDSDRRDYPAFAGKTITVKYFELSKDGIPRFPTFKGIRHDV
jgi:DNA ligase-1